MGPDRRCLTFLSRLHFWGWRTQTAPTITPNKRWQGAWWSMVETDRLMQTPDHIKSQFSSHPQFYLWFRWQCQSGTKLRTLRMIIQCHLQRPQVHTYWFQLTVNAMMNMNTMPNTLIMGTSLPQTAHINVSHMYKAAQNITCVRQSRMFKTNTVPNQYVQVWHKDSGAEIVIQKNRQCTVSQTVLK